MLNVDKDILIKFVNSVYGIDNTKFLVLVKKISHEQLVEQYIHQLIKHGAQLQHIQEAIWTRNTEVLKEWMIQVIQERERASSYESVST